MYLAIVLAVVVVVSILRRVLREQQFALPCIQASLLQRRGSQVPRTKGRAPEVGGKGPRVRSLGGGGCVAHGIRVERER